MPSLSHSFILLLIFINFSSLCFSPLSPHMFFPLPNVSISLPQKCLISHQLFSSSPSTGQTICAVSQSPPQFSPYWVDFDSLPAPSRSASEWQALPGIGFLLMSDWLQFWGSLLNLLIQFVVWPSGGLMLLLLCVFSWILLSCFMSACLCGWPMDSWDRKFLLLFHNNLKANWISLSFVLHVNCLHLYNWSWYT